MLRSQRPYDLRYLIKCLFGLLAIIALMRVTGGAGFAVVFLLLGACMTRRNPELLFYTLLMTIAITMGNCNIVRKGVLFSFLQRFMMLALSGLMIVRIAGSRKSPLLTSFFSVLLYVIFMVFSSASGWCPVISYLKIILFVMVFFAYWGVANSVVESERVNAQKIRSVVLMLSAFFIFGSLALIPFPGLSQLSWDEIQSAVESGQEVTSLFTGMTFHSQSLGPLCSMLGVMLFADLAFSVKAPNRLYIALLACIPILIWKTSSRTAMGSFIAGIMFVIFFFMRARGIRNSWRSKVMSAFISMAIVVSMAVIILPSAREKAANFVLKFNSSKDQDVTFENVTATRRGKWEESIYNFKKSPMIGNGFQVSTSFIGLKPGLTTMSAPVEKGVWVSAVLEEGGVIGMILFCFFIIVVFNSLLKHKCYQGLTGFFMIVLINLGEFTFFSMTAIGGFLWAMVFVSVIFDAQRLREQRRASAIYTDGPNMRNVYAYR